MTANKDTKNMAKLYIVPTPIGNLEDITLRALRMLREADLVLAEDTRTSSVLLKHYDIHVPLESHHKFNEHEKVESVKERILAGKTVALISDAGTPGISDPGSCWSVPAWKLGLKWRRCRVRRLSCRRWSIRVFPVTVFASKGFYR